MKKARWWVVWATPVAMAATAGRSEVWLDFEAADAAAGWVAGRGATLAVVDAEPLPTGLPKGEGPAGRAVRLTAPAGSGAYLSAVPPELSTACALSLWVRCAGEDVTNVDAEVQFVEPDGRSRFWRRVTLERAGWQRVEFPLRFFRTTGARLPDWQQVRYFNLYARQAVTMDVDSVCVERREGCGPEISLQELRQIAFPSAPTGTVRLVRDAEYAVMTDCPQLDLPLVRVVMEQLTRELRRLFPFLRPPSRPAVLLVFARPEEYRAFPMRIAQQMGSVAREPTSDGYTVVGVATSWFDPQKGSLRPVYFHEFVHAWLSQAGGLVCEGHWLHEAVANYLQLKLFPQSGFEELARRSFEQGAARPLRELCSAQPVAISDYWQLVMVFRMLVSKAPYSERLPKLFEAARAHSSFDLGLYLTEVFGVDWDQFEADWAAYCRQSLPAASSAPSGPGAAVESAATPGS